MGEPIALPICQVLGLCFTLELEVPHFVASDESNVNLLSMIRVEKAGLTTPASRAIEHTLFNSITPHDSQFHRATGTSSAARYYLTRWSSPANCFETGNTLHAWHR